MRTDPLIEKPRRSGAKARQDGLLARRCGVDVLRGDSGEGGSNHSKAAAPRTGDQGFLPFQFRFRLRVALKKTI
jgi:hypothetical protein